MNDDCLFCKGHVEGHTLVAPFPYADNEYPKPYTRVCAACLEDCAKWKHTKEEFVKLVYQEMGEPQPETVFL